MDNISTEQKLELVKQIRSKYSENISDMSQRERVLYGRTSYSDKDNVKSYSMVDRSWYYEEPDDESMEHFSFGRVRLFIAIILLAGVITMDLSGKSLMGVSMDMVFTAISQDYEEEIAAWVSHATAKVPEIDTISPEVTEVDAVSTEVTDTDAVDLDSTKKE